MRRPPSWRGTEELQQHPHHHGDLQPARTPTWQLISKTRDCRYGGGVRRPGSPIQTWAPPAEAFPQQQPELAQLLSRVVATLDTMMPSLTPQSNTNPPPSWPPACLPPHKRGQSHSSADSCPDSSDSSNPEVPPPHSQKKAQVPQEGPSLRPQSSPPRVPRTICPGWTPTSRDSGLQTPVPLRAAGRRVSYLKRRRKSPSRFPRTGCPLEISSRLLSKACEKLQLSTPTGEAPKAVQEPSPSRRKFMPSENPSQNFAAPIPEEFIRIRDREWDAPSKNRCPPRGITKLYTPAKQD